MSKRKVKHKFLQERASTTPFSRNRNKKEGAKKTQKIRRRKQKSKARKGRRRKYRRTKIRTLKVMVRIHLMTEAILPLAALLQAMVPLPLLTHTLTQHNLNNNPTTRKI